MTYNTSFQSHVIMCELRLCEHVGHVLECANTRILHGCWLLIG